MLRWLFRYVVLEVVLAVADLAFWVLLPVIAYFWLKVIIIYEYELFMMQFNTILC